jgi:hypothetical protein
MCRSSGFRRTVVQLYDSSKTQNAHNFGHGHATDIYFTFLEMAKKVFLIKIFWHRRDSNPRPIGDENFWGLMLNHHGYIWRRNLHYLLPKNRWWGWAHGCQPSQWARWIFLKIPYLKSA